LGLSTRDANILCEQEMQWKSLNQAQMSALLAQLRPTGEAASMLSELIDLLAADIRSDQEKVTAYNTELQALDAYMQDNTIKVVRSAEGIKEIYFPYKRLNPFNISFNRSLQNLSSYYTDI